jgi:hypothetical protein
VLDPSEGSSEGFLESSSSLSIYALGTLKLFLKITSIFSSKISKPNLIKSLRKEKLY